jgi:2-oxoglutarate ferredoxin oxidoreductase subunit alpha
VPAKIVFFSKTISNFAMDFTLKTMIKNIGFIDNSRLITESLVRAGADVFVGYPITPANLLYLYAGRRFPQFMAAPDEITTMQLMSGLAVTGKIPVTATSFPGFALMIESINMAYMMELPMVIVLVQRLGPATGTATCGAQGDISVVHGVMSGGFTLPTLSMSNSADCWDLPARAVEMAVQMRTPVVLLTSKEEVMTLFSMKLENLPEIKKVERTFYAGNEAYLPYLPDENLVPAFLPVTSNAHQVRITASTHDKKGIIQNTSEEAMANTMRLQQKVEKNMNRYQFYEYDEDLNSDTLLVSYGITSPSARVAVSKLRQNGTKVSHLIVKTIFPVPDKYYEVSEKYKQIFVAEENLTGQYMKLLFGQKTPSHIHGINMLGRMIEPEEIEASITEQKVN